MARQAQQAKNTRSGNRCGHDPRAPRLQIARPLSADSPLVLRLAAAKIQEYGAHPDLLPCLNFANGLPRQQRSERREAAVLVLQMLGKYLDLAAEAVQIPTPTGPIRPTVAWLAEQAGLGHRRAERAIADLKKAGILQILQIRSKNGEGYYRSAAAIKILSRQFFAALGLLELYQKTIEKFRKAKRKLKKRAAKNAEPAACQGPANFGLMLRGLLSKRILRGPRKTGEAEEAEVERERARVEQIRRLRQENPAWSLARCRDELAAPPD